MKKIHLLEIIGKGKLASAFKAALETVDCPMWAKLPVSLPETPQIGSIILLELGYGCPLQIGIENFLFDAKIPMDDIFCNYTGDKINFKVKNIKHFFTDDTQMIIIVISEV